MNRNDEIYTRYKKGESVRSLAAEYGISTSRVYAIISRGNYQKSPIYKSELYSGFARFTTSNNATRFALAFERAGIYHLSDLYLLTDEELSKVWGISNLAIEIVNRCKQEDTNEH